MMKEKDLVIHCVYSQEEVELPQLLEESFRLFLKRILAEHGEQVVFYE